MKRKLKNITSYCRSPLNTPKQTKNHTYLEILHQQVVNGEMIESEFQRIKARYILNKYSKNVYLYNGYEQV